MNYDTEHRIIQQLAQELINTIKKGLASPKDIAYKASARDIVSSLDKKSDALITATIKQHFSGDAIISEESVKMPFRGLPVSKKRAWLIDPLCGSMNVVRGIPLFVTNIVLIENAKVKAAWVVDYARERLIWSTGQREVYENNTQLKKLDTQKHDVQLVHVDCGHRDELTHETIEQYANVLKSIILNDEVKVHCYNSSIGFAYVATGQLQASFSIQCYPWDLLAACFLTEQNGGIVTNLDGTPWNVNTRSAILAGNVKIHRFLLDLVRKEKLSEIV